MPAAWGCDGRPGSDVLTSGDAAAYQLISIPSGAPNGSDDRGPGRSRSRDHEGRHSGQVPVTGVIVSHTSNATAVLQTEGTDYTLATQRRGRDPWLTAGRLISPEDDPRGETPAGCLFLAQVASR